MPFVVQCHYIHDGMNTIVLPADAAAVHVGFQGNDLHLWERHQVFDGSPAYGPCPRSIYIVRDCMVLDTSDPHVGSAEHPAYRAMVHVFLEASALAGAGK